MNEQKAMGKKPCQCVLRLLKFKGQRYLLLIEKTTAVAKVLYKTKYDADENIHS